MDEFIRLFLSGEALQDMLARLCEDKTSSDGAYTICRKMSAMCKTALCVRLTPLGLAPFKNNISLVYLYRWMTEAQKHYVQDILDCIHISPSSCSLLKEYRIQGIALGNEVIVVTWINGERVWGGSEDASLRLRSVDVLKAFVSCVWASSDLTPELKKGVCDINIQMAMHELALTQNTLQHITEYVASFDKP